MATQQNNRNEEKGHSSSHGLRQENSSHGRNRQENQSHSNDNRSSHRGFAAMDDKKQREIASKGGKAVSRDREHMAEIGRKGGEH